MTTHLLVAETVGAVRPHPLGDLLARHDYSW
jgi:hypothetical protein